MDRNLIEWLEGQSHDEIEWGKSDCVTLCNAYIKRSGFDPMPWTKEELSRDVSTQSKVVRELLRGVSRRPMFRKVNPAEVEGDALGLAFVRGQWTLCLHHTGVFWITRAKVGLEVIQTEMVKRAWIWE